MSRFLFLIISCLVFASITVAKTASRRVSNFNYDFYSPAREFLAKASVEDQVRASLFLMDGIAYQKKPQEIQELLIFHLTRQTLTKNYPLSTNTESNSKIISYLTASLTNTQAPQDIAAINNYLLNASLNSRANNMEYMLQVLATVEAAITKPSPAEFLKNPANIGFKVEAFTENTTEGFQPIVNLKQCLCYGALRFCQGANSKSTCLSSISAFKSVIPVWACGPCVR